MWHFQIRILGFKVKKKKTSVWVSFEKSIWCNIYSLGPILVRFTLFLFALVREAAGDTKKAYASVLTSSDQTISHVRSFLPFRKFKTRFVRLKNELFDYLRAVAAVILIFVLCCFYYRWKFSHYWQTLMHNIASIITPFLLCLSYTMSHVF